MISYKGTLISTAEDDEIGVKVTEILDSITKNYDKRVRPNYGRMWFILLSLTLMRKKLKFWNLVLQCKGAPVVIGVTLYVIAFHAVSEAKMVQISVFYYLSIKKFLIMINLK